MNPTGVIILFAASAALLAFGLGQVLAAALNPEKRRLQERLATAGPTKGTFAQRSILVQQQPVDGLDGLLLQLPGMRALSRRLAQAFPDLRLASFLGLSAGAGLALFVIALGISDALFIAAVAGVAAAYVPFLLLNQKRTSRQRALAEQLPEGLDFLSRILRAGHSLSTGLQMMAEELPQPLAGEFRRVYDQHTLGQPLEEGLRDMTSRIHSTDFAFFVTAVLIQRQTGGDLSEVLQNISSMVRQRIRLQQSVKAKTAEGRFTGYILTAFPAVMFLVSYSLNPEYAGVLLSDSTGLALLGTAAGLTVIGLWLIKLITTVKV